MSLPQSSRAIGTQNGVRPIIPGIAKRKRSPPILSRSDGKKGSLTPFCATRTTELAKGCAKPRFFKISDLSQ
jgi:hypothetical protein